MPFFLSPQVSHVAFTWYQRQSELALSKCFPLPFLSVFALLVPVYLLKRGGRHLDAPSVGAGGSASRH